MQKSVSAMQRPQHRTGTTGTASSSSSSSPSPSQTNTSSTTTTPPPRRSLSSPIPSSSSSPYNAALARIILFIALTALCFYGHEYVVSYNEQLSNQNFRNAELQTQVDKWHVELERVQDEELGLKDKVDKLKVENEMLRKKQKKNQNRNVVEEVVGKRKDDGGGETTIKLQQRVDKLVNKREGLEKEIQDMSRRVLLEKFGPGPHRVKIKLDFPPEIGPTTGKNAADADDTFTIELAPIDTMPHATHLFLEQASRGLYDGASFHRNAGHVVQAGPVPYYNTPKAKNLRRDFKESGWESVSFQEYSTNFPHVKYTLGYAGRPGGPDFYVSTMDNTKNHGPGGQTGYDDPSEADSCFAKVVDGFDVVDRMTNMPVKPGWYKAMEENVGIVQMTILK